MGEYNVVDSEQIKSGRFTIVLDTVRKHKENHIYSYIDVKNSVAVLAKKGNGFLFINQYRHTVKDVVLEIPGGAIDDGEEPMSAAKRELMEETGYEVESIFPLGSYYPTVGISNEKCHLFFAECGTQNSSMLEPLEEIEIVYKSEDEIERAIADGKLLHGMALVAWLRYKTGDNDVN